jgi:hypothetical protein
MRFDSCATLAITAVGTNGLAMDACHCRCRACMKPLPPSSSLSPQSSCSRVKYDASEHFFRSLASDIESEWSV